MANILLINAGNKTLSLFRSAVETVPHTIQALSFAEADQQASGDSYDIVFIESAINNPSLTEKCGSFQEVFKNAYIVLILPAFDKIAVQKSYLMCDGSIILPAEHEKLRRIIDWYVAADHMRRIEAVKETSNHTIKALATSLIKNKALIISVLLLTMFLGAIIGLFWSEKSVKSLEDPQPQTIKEKILHELRK
ncbi:MAG: hypothetical protein A2268_01600 [Candidatus Raymondbacteria bacterium RifOxyA12_full_50_37]|uniref:Response regulatory domain-containing protein n=1 Tax=Candidatus Raymondbacteria bacterium RIFOXYD12_FULL_49_13 TaxID=1817890 RepID=A0A1F7F9R6_UNCRA|nr:MAG: hypothetical protein A2268_01600 [Candidatus Raymondbacteria bacterium RifOxyA12_full_50_37]OGJ87760.1 MAG: hypothetical protein A2248_07205 [Candidatus Raymondbacteria bacterium RIFOXYA2_FULL_49_16]OGJ94745.1 MAG: hypothetical protein A2350_12340 [Candidatus Raymondbacteria bacterium RifOxyB12_full_50_8]OGJ95638.1 MAG: hypothetical protein A2453_13200 [Candidatus Raymondbacteria bacterium RIFOXYC2_FULL_50_21]OGK03410.1 MAG: hypothetical protein A2519_15475 [Candidatus Raymondbacteria b